MNKAPEKRTTFIQSLPQRRPPRSRTSMQKREKREKEGWKVGTGGRKQACDHHASQSVVALLFFRASLCQKQIYCKPQRALLFPSSSHTLFIALSLLQRTRPSRVARRPRIFIPGWSHLTAVDGAAHVEKSALARVWGWIQAWGSDIVAYEVGGAFWFAILRLWRMQASVWITRTGGWSARFELCLF